MMCKLKYSTRPLTSMLLVFLAMPFCALAAVPDFNDAATVRGLLSGAIDVDDIQEREKDGVILIYFGDSQKPYTGWIKKMYADGQLKFLFHSKNGLLHGPWSEWREKPHNRNQSQTWKLDKAVLGQYVAGKKEGLWRFGGHGGSEGYYRGGEKEGQWEEGEDRGFYKSGKREGRWEEGRSKGLYESGKKQGLWTLPLGPGTYTHKTEEIFYKDGVKNGIENYSGEEYVYRNGKVVLERSYLAGAYHDGLTGRFLEARPGDFKRIPAVFRGNWLTEPHKHNYLNITSGGVGSHESFFSPLKIEILDQGRAIHMIGLTGAEGDTFKGEIRLRISPDGKKLTDGIITYIRGNTGGGRGG